MRPKRSLTAPVLAAALALATGGWLVDRTVPAPRAGPRLVSQVMRYVATSAVDERAPGELYALAARAVVDALG
ncbi:MAG TPA: hypothetical protein VFH27_07930, partial [Longimicrobiaceae bacterium]|nr:hypothetical protein [Longimicrobiaceae bacterium]